MAAPQQPYEQVSSRSASVGMTTRRISPLKRVLFALLPVIVILGGAELLLRALGIPEAKYTIGEFGFPPPILYETAFRHDPVRFWRLTPEYSGPWEMYKSKYTFERNISPNVIRDRVRDFPDASYYRTVTWGVNADGFRGPDAERGKQVVLFLGSSVTFGWGVRAADSFPALIGQQLALAGNADWTVINAGVPGYSSYQCLKYLEEITARIQPRIIFVEVGINEGVWSPGFPDKLTAAVLEDTFAARCVRTSNLLFAINQQLRGAARGAEPSELPAPTKRFFYTSMYVPGHVRVPEEDFLENLASFEALAHEAGAEIYFLFPGLYNEYGEKQLVKSVKYSHPREIDLVETLSSAARTSGTNLDAYFLPYDEAHLSIKGHRIVAERIWARLTSDAVVKNKESASPR